MRHLFSIASFECSAKLLCGIFQFIRVELLDIGPNYNQRLNADRECSVAEAIHSGWEVFCGKLC